MAFDIITLGSATIDVFVKSKNETIHHKKEGHQHLDIAYHLGEKILIDDLEFSTGGGGTNTAVAFSRLGLKTAFIGALSNDMNGEFISKELAKEGIEFLGKIKPGKSGYSIILPGHNDRAILTFKGVSNDFDITDIHEDAINSNWLYISTTMGKALNAAEKIAILAKQKQIKIAFNPSLYLAKLGINKLRKILIRTDVLILNKEEAEALSGKSNVKEVIEKLAQYVPGIIVITNGSGKIYVYCEGHFYSKLPEKIKVVDSTGAGDAFASGFVYGVMQGKDIETCLEWGLKESDSVLTHIGAKNNLLRHL